MSVFPFIDPDVLQQEESTELPLFREYAYDFQNNCLLLKSGQTYLVEGNEAPRIWIYKALTTERFRYTAYDADFGSEIDTLIGSPLNGDIAKSELKRFIVEALMVNPYIEELGNFQISQTGSGVTAEFDCTTIYGPDKISWEVKGVEM